MIGWCSCFVRICIGYKMTGNITMDQESDMLRHLLYLWKWMLMAMLNLYSLIIYWNWYNTFFIVGIHLSIFHYLQTLSLSNFILSLLNWMYSAHHSIKHVESSICDRAMPFAVKPKTIMPNSNSLQAGEGQWYFVKTNPMLWKTKLHKYHCPSLACKLLLLGIIVFGFTAKGIARS